MKMKVIYLFTVKGCFIVLLLLSFSCKPKVVSELTDQERNKISKEIETVVDNFVDPNLNSEKHIALRADKDGYIYAGDGKILFTDYESYKGGVKSSFDNIQKFIELKSIKTCVYVLSIDAASCTTEFQGKYINTSGDTIVHNGCWTFVFKKFNNEWKVIQENGTHTKE